MRPIQQGLYSKVYTVRAIQSYKIGIYYLSLLLEAQVSASSAFMGKERGPAGSNKGHTKLANAKMAQRKTGMLR